MAGRATRWPATREKVLELIGPVLGRHSSTVLAAVDLGCSDAALRGVCRAHGIDYSTLLRPSAYVPRAPAAGPVVSPPPAPEPEPEPPPPVEVGSAAPGKDRLILIAKDLHVPEHDRPGTSALLAFARERQPDEIVLSEVSEWLSCSQHGGGAWGSSWERDKADSLRFYVQVRSVCPNADVTVEQSNHDTRLDRILEQRLPSFAGSMTIPNELKFRDLGITYVSERTVLRRGALKIIHGHQLANNPIKGMLPKYHAARAVAMYGEAGTTVLYGHVHREQVYSEPCDGGFKRAHSIGCMRTLRPAWHRATEMGHHNQFAVAYVSASGATNLYVVDVQGGAFTFEGRQYRAA